MHIKLIFVTTGRSQESAQSEGKSTTRYGDEVGISILKVITSYTSRHIQQRLQVFLIYSKWGRKVCFHLNIVLKL